MAKLLRITTVYESLRTLFPGQLAFIREQGLTIWVASGPDAFSETGPPNAELEGCSYFQVRLTRTFPAMRQDILALWDTYRLIRRLQPDIVHTHTPKAGLVGMLAALVAGVPVRLHTVAGLPLMERRWLIRWVLILTERITYACATEVWPNSEGLLAYIRANLYKGQKLKLIANGSSNGIDTEYFRQTPSLQQRANWIRKELGMAPDAFVWVFVGRIVRDKGINELIQAFGQLANENPATRLILVGHEEAQNAISPAIRAIIRTHPQIIPVGYQADVRPYLALADVLVLPTYREGLPNVLLQAAALEKPVVASDIPGCREVVLDGGTGLLVTPKSPQALYEAMQKLMDDREPALAMGQLGRERVVARYGQKALWQELLKAYQEALSTARCR